VLLLAVAGLVAASAAYRARDRFAPQQTPPATTAPKHDGLTFSFVSIHSGHRLALRSRPGGRVLARAWWTTEYGSSATLAVAARRGRWLGLTSSDLPNGALGWVRATDPSLELHSTRVSVVIDLSRRTLELRNGREVVRRATVGIGRLGSATPKGRFSITDELKGRPFGRYYGCCIVALSGHQKHTPSGWLGGDRLAIHGTNDPGSIGMRSSAGCLHAETRDLRALIRRAPLGTPVFIHA
jgi:hypothetical protein